MTLQKSIRTFNTTGPHINQQSIQLWQLVCATVNNCCTLFALTAWRCWQLTYTGRMHCVAIRSCYILDAPNVSEKEIMQNNKSPISTQADVDCYLIWWTVVRTQTQSLHSSETLSHLNLSKITMAKDNVQRNLYFKIRPLCPFKLLHFQIRSLHSFKILYFQTRPLCSFKLINYIHTSNV